MSNKEELVRAKEVLKKAQEQRAAIADKITAGNKELSKLTLNSYEADGVIARCEERIRELQKDTPIVLRLTHGEVQLIIQGLPGSAPLKTKLVMALRVWVDGPPVVTAGSVVLDEIFEERVRQDMQWGGPATDDTRSLRDWVSFIGKQLNLIYSIYNPPSPQMIKERLVKIGALVVAALESQHRLTPPLEE